MSASTHIWLYSPRNTRLANIAPAWEAGKGYRFSYLRYRRSGHEITELVLRMPKAAAPPRGYFALDSRIEVWRADGPGPARLDMDTVWFVRVPPKLIYGPKGEQLIEIRASNALYLLAGRIVAYAAGSAQAIKSGPADDLMKAVVRENRGSSAVADRDLSAWLSVDSDQSLGANVYRTFPRSNVLRVLQAVSRASAQGGEQVFFDVVPEDGRLVFRTFLGQRGADRRRSSGNGVTLSPEFGTLREVERAEDHRDEFTVIYTAGQGVGDTRMLVTLTDAERASASPFNRREQFVDARYIPTEDGLSTEADAALWRGRPDQVFSAVLPPNVYGRLVRWGDRATAELDSEVVDCVLHGVEVELQDGEEVIKADLRSDGADAEDAVRRIEGAIDAGGGADAPLFTVTPAPDAVPLAGEDGHIDIDWLDPADLVVAWADITGKPSTFPPSSHASSHATGGSDAITPAAIGASPVGHNHAKAAITDLETITAAPTASAVPKAGVGGTLADGWLSAAIARVSGLPSTLPPSGPAGGDLYDSYPNPYVQGIHGFEFEDPNPSQPDQGAVYVYDQGWPGWALSNAAGISGVQEAAGVYKVPLAGSTGKIADGWLNTTIARLTDLTWANITGKPAAFAPSAHAASHKHGGTDEIATATSAANAIPKADSAGKLADAWLNTTIARLTDLTWANVSGKPSTFAPSAHAASHASAGSDPITPAAIGASAVGHTHVKANVTDLETITATPTASAVPKGDGSGKLADGWLNATIARLTDLTWANVSGKPTFTTTPTASAIPQGDGSGKLADGWLSANVALENVANTFTLAQVVSATHTVAATTAPAFTFQMNSTVATAAGFGQDVYFNLEADSGTNRTAGLLRNQWAVAADLTRRGRLVFYCYDAAGARECLRLEASGTAPMVSFNGVGAVARQAIVALSMAVGTGDNSVADVGTVFSQATLNNNFRDVVNKINELRTILVNVGLAS